MADLLGSDLDLLIHPQKLIRYLPSSLRCLYVISLIISVSSHDNLRVIGTTLWASVESTKGEGAPRE